MSVEQTRAGSIQPCPFSEGFRIPVNQAWGMLLIYSVYRIALAGLFSLLSNLRIGPVQLGKFSPESFLIVSNAYLALSLLAMFCLLIRKPGFPIQVQAQVSLDIVALTLVMHASGGVASGIGILIGVSLAAGGLMTGGRCALLFAAFSTFAVGGEQIYSYISTESDPRAFAYTGMLGISFFTISLLALGLAKRAEQSDALAAEKALELADQELLNAHIIDHLQSSIIILDQDEKVQLMNPSALSLFGLSANPLRIEAISKKLADHFHLWQLDNAHDSVVLAANATCNVNVRFTRFERTHKPYYMIFLEDSRLTNQRVQQSKLASLGRLTASIAHEIRNPLSAINHASQLLAESSALDKQDQRLIEIIRQHTLRVNDVIEAVLQISRRRESKPELLDLKAWIEKFIAEFALEQQLSESVFQVFAQAGGIHVRFDPVHLKQIMLNLFSNALKYGRKGREPIEIRFGSSQSLCCIEICDRGPGIGADQAQQIFEPFFTTSTTGTGLGLYIAKELAELNLAKLEYEPRKFGGSCFRVCLPAADNNVIAI